MAVKPLTSIRFSTLDCLETCASGVCDFSSIIQLFLLFTIIFVSCCCCPLIDAWQGFYVLSFFLLSRRPRECMWLWVRSLWATSLSDATVGSIVLRHQSNSDINPSSQKREMYFLELDIFLSWDYDWFRGNWEIRVDLETGCPPVPGTPSWRHIVMRDSSADFLLIILKTLLLWKSRQPHWCQCVISYSIVK